MSKSINKEYNNFIFYNKTQKNNSNFEFKSISSVSYDFFKAFLNFTTSKNEQDYNTLLNALPELISFVVSNNLTGNIWAKYITYLLISDTNPYTLNFLQEGCKSSTLSLLAENDLRIFYNALKFNFLDFKLEEPYTSIDLTILLKDFKLNTLKIDSSDVKNQQGIDQTLGDVSCKLQSSTNFKEFKQAIEDFYSHYGSSLFAFYQSFRLDDSLFNSSKSSLSLIPNIYEKHITLTDIVGYTEQKKELCDNTLRFAKGKSANNVLLYGESGTGKSASIKAIVNEYKKDGIRLVEVSKNQIAHLSLLIEWLGYFNFKFIIYLDDLSFDNSDDSYKYLKPIIEGRGNCGSGNVLVYVTSNRRNLVAEKISDGDDFVHNEDLHTSETKEEKLSLASRFGLSIYYPRPQEAEYFNIVTELASKKGVKITQQTLIDKARIWGVQGSGYSGRSAQQFVDSL